MMDGAGVILKASSLTCLALETGCCWDLSWARTLVSGFHVWPRLPHSLVVGSNGECPERKNQMDSILPYGLASDVTQ